ncbi:MAG: hypothetical protein KF797_10820 [Flavobacteriales bacterium]|nr:hypothetical protein [Flavobacteriales bacterium]
MAAAEDSASTRMEKHVFPAYRQLNGGRHYYRITTEDRFDELQRVGDRWVLHEVHAAMYPERVRIQEMLLPMPPFEPLDEADWAAAHARATGG